MSSQQKVTSWSSWAPLLPSRSQMTVISTLYRTDLRCILFSIQVPSNISVYAVTSKHRKITCRTHVDMGQEDAVHHLSYFITMVKVQWTTASYKRTPGGMFGHLEAQEDNVQNTCWYGTRRCCTSFKLFHYYGKSSVDNGQLQANTRRHVSQGLSHP